MKLVISNGKELEVREVGPAGAVPIKLHGRFVLEDAEARDLLSELRKAGAGCSQCEA
jgi:hypothetical protein